MQPFKMTENLPVILFICFRNFYIERFHTFKMDFNCLFDVFENFTCFFSILSHTQ